MQAWPRNTLHSAVDVESLRFGVPREWHSMKFADIAKPQRWQLPVAEVLYGVRDEPGEKPSLELGANEAAQSWLARLDAHVLSTVKHSCKVWFDKEVQDDVVSVAQFRVLRDNMSYRAKLAWAGKWTDTQLWSVDSQGVPSRGEDWSEVAAGRLAVPIVKPGALWFSNRQFGLSLQLTDLLLLPDRREGEGEGEGA